jgi:hypothetical protein
MVLRRYHHPCIVKLIGCCWTTDTKALLYELMEAGALTWHEAEGKEGKREKRGKQEVTCSP